MAHVNDLTNRKFGRLIVLKDSGKRRYGNVLWLCRCDCGSRVELRGCALISHNTRSCGCLKKDYINSLRTGFEGLTGSYWRNIVKHVKNKPMSFNINAEYAWQLFLAQKGQCALSGLTLDMPTSKGGNGNAASLDRIDSSKGYIKGNVQWVHRDINWMKGSLSQVRFLDLCSKITARIGLKDERQSAKRE
mgnify:FL=1